MREIAWLMSDLNVELNNANVELSNVTDKYDDGWEDRALDIIIGFQSYLEEFQRRIEVITGKRLIDLGDADLVSDP